MGIEVWYRWYLHQPSVISLHPEHSRYPPTTAQVWNLKSDTWHVDTLCMVSTPLSRATDLSYLLQKTSRRTSMDHDGPPMDAAARRHSIRLEPLLFIQMPIYRFYNRKYKVERRGIDATLTERGEYPSTRNHQWQWESAQSSSQHPFCWQYNRPTTSFPPLAPPRRPHSHHTQPFHKLLSQWLTHPYHPTQRLIFHLFQDHILQLLQQIQITMIGSFNFWKVRMSETACNGMYSKRTIIPMVYPIPSQDTATMDY